MAPVSNDHSKRVELPSIIYPGLSSRHGESMAKPGIFGLRTDGAGRYHYHSYPSDWQRWHSAKITIFEWFPVDLLFPVKSFDNIICFNIESGDDLLPDGTKPLHEQPLSYCSMDTQEKTLHWNKKQNMNFSIQPNALENVDCKMSATLLRHQCVNPRQHVKQSEHFSVLEDHH